MKKDKGGFSIGAALAAGFLAFAVFAAGASYEAPAVSAGYTSGGIAAAVEGSVKSQGCGGAEIEGSYVVCF